MPTLLDSALDPASNEEICTLLKEENYDLVLKHNILLIYNIADSYKTRHHVMHSDLVQEGCLGLLHACPKYDIESKASFCTYASFWIRQYMSRSMMTETAVRIPPSMYTYVRKYRKLKNKLEREPSKEEVLEHLGCYNSTAILVKNTSKVEYVHESEFFEMVDETVACRVSVIQESMALGWHLLDEREIDILTKRFGLDGKPAQVLEEVSIALGISRERVRQIQRDSLRKLKPYLKELYYD